MKVWTKNLLQNQLSENCHQLNFYKNQQNLQKKPKKNPIETDSDETESDHGHSIMKIEPLHAQLQMKAQLPVPNIKSQPITKTSEKKTKTASSQQHHPKLPLQIHLQTKPIQEEQGIFTELDKKPITRIVPY